MNQKSSILVVEDDDAIRNSLVEVLEAESYEVLSARDGRQGLEILQNRELPKWILLDIRMPVMNGYEFVETVQNDPLLKSIPITFLSADGRFTRQTEVERVPVSSWLRKPVDLEDLLSEAKRFCNRS